MKEVVNVHRNGDNMKKFIKYLFVFILLLSICDTAFAVSMWCPALGETVRIEYQIARIIRYVILILQIAVPIILVILGTVDLMKSVAAQKEDEIKKGQQIFVKRLIAGVLVFFVIALVKLVTSVASNGDPENVMTCAYCFLKADKDDASCGWE